MTSRPGSNHDCDDYRTRIIYIYIRLQNHYLSWKAADATVAHAEGLAD